MTRGIHHVTVIAGEPQRVVDFHGGVLGLRLVKRTVNFDDPGTYHLYFGDREGRPGTILTFFPWPGAVRGRRGTGGAGATAFLVPEDALDWWRARLEAAGTAVTAAPRFGERALAFEDPDGLALELVASPAARSIEPWLAGPVPPSLAIRGFHGVTLWESAEGPTEEFLASRLGFTREAEEGNRVRFHSPISAADTPGTRVDVIRMPGTPRARSGAGAVHHVAFRAADDADQVAMRERLDDAGVGVTEVIDRGYFRSIYFHEPGGVLFEIATDPPGFTADEPEDALGESLKLPAWLEPARPRIEGMLPPLSLPARTPA